MWLQRKHAARSRVPSLSVLLSVPCFPDPVPRLGVLGTA